MLISNNDIPDSVYEIITSFFNLCLSIMLLLGIINSRKEGPLNSEANTREEVNILLLSIKGNILPNLISGINESESNRNENKQINTINAENLVITSMFLDVK